MTPAQELLDLLKDMKPGANYEKPQPVERKPAPYTGRIYEAMPLRPFAELRELGGSASLVSTRGFDAVYCRSCAKPREQRRVHVPASEKLPAGSYLDVQPCEVCL